MFTVVGQNALASESLTVIATLWVPASKLCVNVIGVVVGPTPEGVVPDWTTVPSTEMA